LQKLKTKTVLIILFHKQHVIDSDFIWRSNSDQTSLSTGAGKVTEMEFQSEVVILGERQLAPFTQQCSCSFGPNNKILSRELLGGGNQPPPPRIVLTAH
jgi:hypothetical protein